MQQYDYHFCLCNHEHFKYLGPSNDVAMLDLKLDICNSPLHELNSANII